ncbi:MAG: YraN family protein [Gammaproteobacteria bacterium]|nr:YraN family protein [Gammaproteobacteria bacterium]
MDEPTTTGQQGEQLARSYLLRQGLRFITSNYRSRRGEIDLIMRDGNALVFIEVRYRRPSSFGGGLDSISLRKQRRLIAAALHYLQSLPGNPPACRFDIIAIDGERPEDGRITWLQNVIEHH